MAGIAALSDIVVALGFGDRWVVATGPLAVLSVSAAVMAISIPSGALAFADGRPHVLMPAMGMGTVALAAGLLLTASTGSITLMSLSVLFSACVTALLMNFISLKKIELTLREFAKELLPTFVSTVVMTIAIVGSKTLLIGRVPLIPAALILVASGGLWYVLTFLVFFRKEFVGYVRDVKAVLIPSRGEDLT
jgi:O-antigen/teichoic acid export membrane protein